MGVLSKPERRSPLDFDDNSDRRRADFIAALQPDPATDDGEDQMQLLWRATLARAADMNMRVRTRSGRVIDPRLTRRQLHDRGCEIERARMKREALAGVEWLKAHDPRVNLADPKAAPQDNVGDYFLALVGLK